MKRYLLTYLDVSAVKTSDYSTLGSFRLLPRGQSRVSPAIDGWDPSEHWQESTDSSLNYKSKVLLHLSSLHTDVVTSSPLLLSHHPEMR